MTIQTKDKFKQLTYEKSEVQFGINVRKKHVYFLSILVGNTCTYSFTFVESKRESIRSLLIYAASGRITVVMINLSAIPGKIPLARRDDDGEAPC